MLWKIIFFIFSTQLFCGWENPLDGFFPFREFTTSITEFMTQKIMPKRFRSICISRHRSPCIQRPKDRYKETIPSTNGKKYKKPHLNEIRIKASFSVVSHENRSEVYLCIEKCTVKCVIWFYVLCEFVAV